MGTSESKYKLVRNESTWVRANWHRCGAYTWLNKCATLSAKRRSGDPVTLPPTAPPSRALLAGPWVLPALLSTTLPGPTLIGRHRVKTAPASCVWKMTKSMPQSLKPASLRSWWASDSEMPVMPMTILVLVFSAWYSIAQLWLHTN